MAFCTNCGNPLKEGDKFCTACGKPVSNNNNQSVSNNKPSVSNDNTGISNNDQNSGFSVESTRASALTTPTHVHQQPTEQMPVAERHPKHEPDPVPEMICPNCGRKCNTLKRYTMFKECLFLGCYIKWQMVTYTCCPDCMRKKILDESIFTPKIITANFFWLFIILPLAIIQLFLCSRNE